ncbi:MAG TPA: Gfo/Idh/MocA family oxidoreductase [Trebonia sp.]|nr:Gfo/Idh/MocA family oxidoreductase [Trebonia sp.]
MSTGKPLRAGLIGLGRMGRNHARVLRQLDGVTLVAAADPAGDPYHAADGIPVLRDADDLLAVGIDYAVLACPTGLHEGIGTRLAAAGMPALIEKPLAPGADAGRRLAAAFSDAGVPAAVGYIERFNPALIAMRARLADGQLGEVFQLVTRRIGPFPARITDVGVVQDLATHDLDLTAWVTGQCYVEIAARTRHLSGRPHEDLLAAVAVLDGGTIAHHLVNWLSPLKERAVVATGVNGCLAADTLTSDLTYWANGANPTPWDGLTAFRGVTEGDVTRYAIPRKEPLLAEHEAWRDAVLGKPSPTTPLSDGVTAILVAEAVIEAARTGITMPVPGLAQASVA